MSPIFPNTSLLYPCISFTLLPFTALYTVILCHFIYLLPHSVLAPFPLPLPIFPPFSFLTSLISLEWQRLRRGSLSLAVKHSNGQVIVGVWPEITDHLLLLIGPSLNHHCALWLPGPSGSVVSPGAHSGQVDLDPPKSFEVINISYTSYSKLFPYHDYDEGFERVIFLWQH